MACWPPCSPWCDCINNQCNPSAVAINAVHFQTSAGAFLTAVGGGGPGFGVNTPAGGAGPFNTFRFVSPTPMPLPFHDGATFALVICDASFSASSKMVFVDQTILPSGELWSFDVGGPGTFVRVDSSLNGFTTDPGYVMAQTQFTILRKAGAGLVASGDAISIRVNNMVSTRGPFFFALDPSGAISASGTEPFLPATTFTMTFLDVRPGLGIRPDPIVCQNCATVTAHVTDRATGNAISGAKVVATNVSALGSFMFAGVTQANGSCQLIGGPDGVSGCIPAGSITVTTTDPHHQTSTLANVNVPGNGSVDANIQLDCTVLSGKIDPGRPITERFVVTLFDSDHAPAGWTQYVNVDGSFSFNCVRQGTWTITSLGVTSGCTSQTMVNIPPEGADITLGCKACQGVQGEISDSTTGSPIPGGQVQIVQNPTATLHEITDGSGNYLASCVPAGVSVTAVAPNYLPKTAPISYPPAGPAVVNIALLAVWNTGVNSQALPLTPNVGNPPPDPHWKLISGPGGATPPQNVFVLSDQRPGDYFSTPDSRWIWADASGAGTPGIPYVFQLQFNLAGYVTDSVVISGAWGVDNNGQITVNGVVPPAAAVTGTIALANAPSGDPNPANFNPAHDFTISGISAPGLFKLGMNSIEIAAQNVGAATSPLENPAGLNVTKLNISARAISRIPIKVHLPPL